MKKSIRVVIFLFVIAMLPGLFQGFNHGFGNKQGLQLIPPALANDSCGAYVAPGVWKEFDCYNLAAIGKTTNDDPFTPSWRLIGGYWQWGRKGPNARQWYDTNTANFAHGPTGPGASEANEGSISGWDGSHAPNSAWSDSTKTANDPCPTGYRVPTKSQWDGVRNNNDQKRTFGVWEGWPGNPTNYNNARFFGDNLMLMAAGSRDGVTGALYNRGSGGYFWSSTEGAISDSRSGAWYVGINISASGINDAYYGGGRKIGLSVRCIKDHSPPPCTYGLSAISSNFSSDGGTETVSVTTSISDCAWITSNSLDWVSLSPTSGTGSRSVTVSVTANSGASRTGSITIAGQIYTITQAAPPVLSLNPSIRNVSSDSGTTTFSVSNTGDGIMNWTAAVTDGGDWLSISSGTSGSNTGTISCQYSNNTEAVSRTGTIRISATGAGNSPIDVTITQSAPPVVSAPTSISVPSTSSSSSYAVSWSSSSTSGVTYVLEEATNTSFISNRRTAYSGTGTSTSITGRNVGTTYYYRVKATKSGSMDSNWRTGSNGCQILQPPVLSLNPSIRNVSSDSGTTTFSVSNTGTGTLTWSAAVVLGEDWLTISDGSSGTDAGTIICEYDKNTGSSSRTATIRIIAADASASPMDVIVTQLAIIPFDMDDHFDAMKVISGQVTGTDAGKDINDDGKIGLPEAIYPLQIMSNQKAQLCGAYVTSDVWKEFDCYNLAAIGKTTGDDPFTPSWRLIGGYWQWGRKGPSSSQWHYTNTEHFDHGPTGPGQDEANEGEISGWDDDYAPDGSWSDSEKTANDPCPAGYRVPTIAQWEGVLDNNTQSTVGTWSDSATNYSSARFFGNDLMLPAAGHRGSTSGALDYRGRYGLYWGSSRHSGFYAWSLSFDSGTARSNYYNRRRGFSVRCIADTQTVPVLSVMPLTQDVDSGAGTTSFDISNTGAGTLTWSAVVTSGSEWLAITSGGNGTDSGTLTCEYQANTEPESLIRTGIIQITSSEAAQGTIEVSVVQAALEKSDQTIEFSTYPDELGIGEISDLFATADSNLEVVFSSQTPSICSVSGSTVTGIEPGTCTIAADQAGNEAYHSAPTVTRSFTVTDQNVFYLTETTRAITITADMDAVVYGSAFSNEIILESGAKAELIDFTGSNTIRIQSKADEFTVFHTDTVVTFQGTDGTLLTIPATQTVQIIEFDDRSSLALNVRDGQIMLDDQVIKRVVLEKSQSFGPEGGSMEIEDPLSPIFKAMIQTRPDSLSKNIPLQLGVVQSDLPENPSFDGALSNYIYCGPHGTFFSRDAKVTIPFDRSLLPDDVSEKDITVAYWNGNHWLAVGTESINVETKTISFNTAHFSVFQAGWGKKDNPEIEWFNVSRTQFNLLSILDDELDKKLEDILFEARINDLDGLDDIKRSYLEVTIHSARNKLADELIEQYKKAAKEAAAEIWGVSLHTIEKLVDPIYDAVKPRHGIIFPMFDTKVTAEGVVTSDITAGDGIFTFLLSKQMLKSILLANSSNFLTRLEAQAFVWDKKDQMAASEKVTINLLFNGLYQFNTDILTPENEAFFSDIETGPYLEWSVPKIKNHTDTTFLGTPGSTLYISKDKDKIFTKNAEHIFPILTSDGDRSPDDTCGSEEKVVNERNSVVFKCGEKGNEASHYDQQILLEEGVYYLGIAIEGNEGGNATQLTNKLLEQLEDWTRTVITEKDIYSREDTEKSVLPNNDSKTPVFKFSVGKAPDTIITSYEPSDRQVDPGDTVTVNFKGSDTNKIAGFWWWTSEDPVKRGVTERWLEGEAVSFKVPDNISEIIFYVQAEDETDILDPDFAKVTFSVRDAYPPLDAVISVSDSSPEIGQLITFTAEVSGGNGQYSYSWDFGDNGTSNLARPSHDYDSADKYTVTLTVADTAGNEKIVSAEVTVLEDDDPTGCGAYVAPGKWKVFDCYNLGADGRKEGIDPFTPSWRLIGGYWQWGRKGPDQTPDDWYKTSTEHFAPGPTEGGNNPNSDAIPGWSEIPAENFDDPCPEGFRVPTIGEWEDVLANNVKEFVGDSWTSVGKSGATNYQTGLKLGNALFLPAAGYRFISSGELELRGGIGYYWSSSESAQYRAWNLGFDTELNSGNVGTSNYLHRKFGFSVRCISE